MPNAQPATDFTEFAEPVSVASVQSVARGEA